MSLRDLLNQKEQRLAQVKKNLEESKIDPNLIEMVMTATTASINEATDALEKAIEESETSTETAEKAIKEAEEAKSEAEKAIKEAEEAKNEPMNESTQKVIGALVNLEVSNHLSSIKEMKNFEANRKALESLAESTIHVLGALGIDIITDANKAIVESTNKRYENLLNKHNDFVDKSNKSIRESNLVISKMKADNTAFRSNAMKTIAESIFTGATQNLSLIEKDKVKSLIESKSFDTPESYADHLNKAISSLNENANPEGKGNNIVTGGRLDENKHFEQNKQTNITPNVVLTGSVF